MNKKIMSVEKYKVLFEDNKAVSAEQVDLNSNRHIHINTDGHKRHIDWFVVYAYDEQDAIMLANELVLEPVWQNYLHKN